MVHRQVAVDVRRGGHRPRRLYDIAAWQCRGALDLGLIVTTVKVLRTFLPPHTRRELCRTCCAHVHKVLILTGGDCDCAVTVL